MKNYAQSILNKFNEMNLQKPKRASLIAFVSIAIACGIVNILTASIPWALFVIVFERLVWKLIFCKRLFENSLPNRILVFSLGISFFLISLMIVLYESPGAMVAIPLVCCGLQLGVAILYLFQYRKNAVLSPVYLLDSLVVHLFSLIIGVSVNSYAVIMVSIAAIMFIVPVLILMQDEIISESRKRLHMC